jgi:hypothetical protein
MNTSPDWKATRRGRAVTIRGFVLHPRDAMAIFDRIPEPRTDCRTFRFYFNPPHDEAHSSDFMRWVSHTEPDVPLFVRRLKIVLQDGRTVAIESQWHE